jgi:hypothetical protein
MFLKELVSCLNRSLLGQFLMLKKRTPFSGHIYAALAGVLLNAHVYIQPMAIPLNKSGVPTCPLDVVTFSVVEYKYFKYLTALQLFFR